jgi:hypothetical protein
MIRIQVAGTINLVETSFSQLPHSNLRKFPSEYDAHMLSTKGERMERKSQRRWSVISMEIY